MLYHGPGPGPVDGSYYLTSDTGGTLDHKVSLVFLSLTMMTIQYISHHRHHDMIISTQAVVFSFIFITIFASLKLLLLFMAWVGSFGDGVVLMCFRHLFF